MDDVARFLFNDAVVCHSGLGHICCLPEVGVWVEHVVALDAHTYRVVFGNLPVEADVGIQAIALPFGVKFHHLGDVHQFAFLLEVAPLFRC